MTTAGELLRAASAAPAGATAGACLAALAAPAPTSAPVLALGVMRALPSVRATVVTAVALRAPGASRLGHDQVVMRHAAG